MRDTDMPSSFWAPTPGPAVARNMCTDCGVSRTAKAHDCGRACQFIQPDYTDLDAKVHARVRNPDKGDERFFGVYRAMYKAALKRPRTGAQWTGLTTRLAERLLEEGAIDAVLTMAPDPDDFWKPMPVIVTDPSVMAQTRGMRMGYAPLLSLMEPARLAGHRRIAVIGIPCQVYALRALEAEWGFERIFVIGTPCSDNTSTENFHTFLDLLDDAPETVTYLEFRADFKVELRYTDGRRREIPFLKLPISDLPADFFPLTCRTCVDYTNTLADITVGYMAGEGEQWLIVRNKTGQELLEFLGDEVILAAPGDKGRRAGSVRGFLANTRLAAGGLPLRRMPNWVRGMVGWLMPKIGPKGLEFARARVEMKAIETILHLRRHRQKRMRKMVPDHVWRVAEPYELFPQPGERD